MMKWLVSLATERSFLFDGLHAQQESDYLRLTRVGGTLPQKEMWSPERRPTEPARNREADLVGAGA
jgi:hypothetical protein